MSFLERQLEDPARLRRIRRLFYAGLALAALAEILLGNEGHFPFERWPAFGSLYGFVSCVMIIVVSKRIGKAWLMRREDTHDD